MKEVSIKVEPKFHEGDWVVRGKTIAQILDIQEQYYVGLDIDGNDFTSSRFLSDDKIHLWTIQDAKDGDVLATKDAVFIFKHMDKIGLSLCKSYCEVIDNSELGLGFDFSINDVYPATKEQRETLFKAMADAGYTFDFEKKELRKIIDEKQIKKNLQDNSFRRMFEQKSADRVESSAFKDKLLELFQKFRFFKEDVPTNGDIIEYVDAHMQELIDTVQNKSWSEEDENRINRLIAYFEDKESFTAEDDIVYANWLKSLKDKHTWKPSDEQMGVIEAVINNRSFQRRHLDSLYEQLKKLKG